MNELTDFTSHHIEGIAREGNTPFNVPLISQVQDNLWQGGCINGVSLGGKFKHVISLYPWERFNHGKQLDSFLEVALYDSGTIPDVAQMTSIANWINICRAHGTTLVHCQAGLNRSGLVTGLALVLSGMQSTDAIALLRKSRHSAVLCNKAFEQWLLKQ
jgi:hypothetical protein